MSWSRHNDHQSGDIRKLKIDDQNAQEKIMDDLLANIVKAEKYLHSNIHILNTTGVRDTKEKIRKLTFMYNDMITTREDKSNKLKPLYQPGEQSETERAELYRLIEDA